MTGDQPDIAIGFDGTAASGLTVAVLVRTADGHLHLEHATAPPGVTEQQVRAWVAEHLNADPPPPPASLYALAAKLHEEAGGDQTLADAVVEWTENWLREGEPQFQLSDWQREALRAAYEEGGLTSSSFVSKPRGWVSPERWAL